jgi:hypothetical protein
MGFRSWYHITPEDSPSEPFLSVATVRELCAADDVSQGPVALDCAILSQYTLPFTTYAVVNWNFGAQIGDIDTTAQNLHTDLPWCLVGQILSQQHNRRANISQDFQ